MKRLVISTGAGMSAESGISTFRDAGGLWEQYPVMEVCSADGFRRNPELVHRFYNDRRQQLARCHPNEGHTILAQLEKRFHVQIITQNVDDLHERAGSTSVLHLHGELTKVRALDNENLTFTLTPPHLSTTPQTLIQGHHVRPHIVFFQEAVPNFPAAASIVGQAHIFVIIGTSLAVYPAASLLQYAPPGIPVFYIDPAPAQVPPGVTVIKATASQGLRELQKLI